MSIIIQKYGGTSVGSIERMRHVAELIVGEQNQGHKVVVIASAMAGATNQLVKLAEQFQGAVGTDAYDFTVATGENVSCGLLALALAEKGINAMPLAGWQIPIRTNNIHSNARITQIDVSALLHLLNQGIIPVITGFQGLSSDQRITTLGRGGSDTSAVAIAAALKAQRCDIYTDIDGLYTADPRLVSDARFIATVAYPTALQMAALGTKIIHPRAVAIGMESKIPIRILSSFGSDKFTTLSSKAAASGIVGISHMPNCALVNIPVAGVHDAEAFLSTLRESDISIDRVHESDNVLSLCADHTDALMIKHRLPCAELNEGYAKVSVVGGINSSDVKTAQAILREDGHLVHYIMSDHSRLSVVVTQADVQSVVNRLHTTFFGPPLKKIDFKAEIQ
jgi:aspartate kinase